MWGAVRVLLFEQPITLLVILAIAELALLWRWANRQTRKGGVAVIVGAACCVVLPVISVLVHTSAERIIELCHDAAHAVDEGDVGGLGRMLDAEFHAESLDK